MFRPRALSRCWLFLPAILILLAQGRAGAQTPRCADDPECRNHLDRGMALDLARSYELALREFQAAYKQQKDPRLALNIGRTLHKLGRFAEAVSWYKDAGRAAPADTALQKQLQEFIVQAQQNLPAASTAQKPVTVVNQPTFAVQAAPVNVSSTATAVNYNHIRIDPSALLFTSPPEPRPLYKRASLWVPLLGLVVAAGAAGIAAATWPRPWQPDPRIPSSSYSALTVGGAK